MDLFLNEYIKKILYGGDTFKFDTKPSNLQQEYLEQVERKIDNYLLSIYRDLNSKPKDLLKEYKLEDIMKFKKLSLSDTETIIYEERYDRNIQKLSSITDYFIYPCRMKCLVEKSSFSPYDIYLKALEKNKKFNQDQKKQLLYDMKKHPNCSLLHFRRLIHILKEMMGNRTDIKYIDSSSGWGDRMIAALLLGVEEYVGYDPNECLTKGHTEIINYFKDDLFGKYSSSNSSKSTSQSTYKSYQVIYKPFENEYPGEKQYNNYFDICVSSPPFFTVEIYSEEITQSTSNYKTADDWLYKFLIPSFKKVMKFLKPSGYLCWYIEDRPEYKFLDIFFKTIDNLNICKYIRKIGYKYDDDDKVRYFYIWQKNNEVLMKRSDNYNYKYNRNLLHVHYSAIVPYKKILNLLKEKYSDRIEFHENKRLKFIENQKDPINWDILYEIINKDNWLGMGMFYHIIKSAIFFEDYNKLILDELERQKIRNVEFRIRLGSFRGISIKDELKMFYDIRKLWNNSGHDFKIIFNSCKTDKIEYIIPYLKEVNELYINNDWVKEIICGYDFSCSEEFGRKLRQFKPFIKDLKMPPLFHAGEIGKNVFDNINFCIEIGCKRIGHGIYAANDKLLLEKIKKKDICLELCPLSNVGFHITKTIEELIKMYEIIIDSGVAYCINSDDPNKFNDLDLEDNYKWCEQNLKNFDRKISEYNSIKYSSFKPK